MDVPSAVEWVRIVFDSDLDRVTLPGDNCERIHSMRASVKPDSPVMCMPKTLAKVFTVEVETEEGWTTVANEQTNLRRLVSLPIGRAVTAIRLSVAETWGAEDVRVMSFDFA